MLLVPPPEAPPVPLVATTGPAPGERWFRLALFLAWAGDAGWLARAM
jgi:hypothetical protein